MSQLDATQRDAVSGQLELEGQWHGVAARAVKGKTLLLSNQRGLMLALRTDWEGQTVFPGDKTITR